MIIAQISDFHTLPKDQLVFGAVDSRSSLTDAVDAVLRLDPPPDVVLVTGDLADRPAPEVYAHVAEELARITMPTFIVPGNHDSRSALLDQFSTLPTIEKERFVAYAIDDYPVRLIGLDSTVEGNHTVEFCSRRASWLDATLAERPKAPTLIFLHHPPMESGVIAMDFLGFDWTHKLEEVIRKHPQVVRITCGHHHRPMTAVWAGTVVTVAPSTSHQFPARFGEKALPAYVIEPPGMLLHYWTGRSLVTHTVPIDTVETREFFTGKPELWQATMEKLRAGEPHPQVDTTL